MSFRTDDIEARVDEILAEVMRRQRQRASYRRVGADEVDRALAGLRREVRCWRARAASDAPRAEELRP